jgi:hypothetical protein
LKPVLFVLLATSLAWGNPLPGENPQTPYGYGLTPQANAQREARHLRQPSFFQYAFLGLKGADLASSAIIRGREVGIAGHALGLFTPLGMLAQLGYTYVGYRRMQRMTQGQQAVVTSVNAIGPVLNVLRVIH